MADDSASPPPVADSTSPAPVSPSDQTLPPADIGQQAEGTWPDSTKMANTPNPADSSSSNLANNSQATSSAEPLSEPLKEETPPQAVSSEIGQVSEIQPIPQETLTSSDTTWPDSTNLANGGSADSSDLANPTPLTDQTDISANSSPPSIEPISTPSQEPISTVSADSPPPTPPLPLPPSSPPFSVPVPETPPALETTPEPSEAVKPPEEKVDTNVQLPNNQATVEQQEAPNVISTIDTEKPPEDLANFKPEPLESSQNAPLANQNLTDSSQKSFGDLLSSENQSPSNPTIPPIPSTPSIPPISSSPPVSSTAPSVSFGDLIKDIKPEESVIHPPPVPPPPTSSPTVSIPHPQPTTNNPQPLSPPSPVSPQIGDLSLRRQKANQVRSQKKTNHLSKIMELAKNTKSISNTDVQRLLHVSQSTATNYLAELARKGMLKRQGTRGGAKYTL